MGQYLSLRQGQTLVQIYSDMLYTEQYMNLQTITTSIEFREARKLVEVILQVYHQSRTLTEAESVSLVENDLNMKNSDVMLWCHLMCLLNQSNGEYNVDIKDLSLCFLVLIQHHSFRELIQNIFILYDQDRTGSVSKQTLIHIIHILNKCFVYFGDNPLSERNLVNFVDSLFTSSGLIDGVIYYDHFLEIIVDHPIVHVWLSKPYQSQGENIRFENENSIQETGNIYLI